MGKDYTCQQRGPLVLPACQAKAEERVICEVTWCYVMSRGVMSCHVVSCHVTWCDVVSRGVMSYFRNIYYETFGMLKSRVKYEK